MFYSKDSNPSPQTEKDPTPKGAGNSDKGGRIRNICSRREQIKELLRHAGASKAPPEPCIRVIRIRPPPHNKKSNTERNRKL